MTKGKYFKKTKTMSFSFRLCAGLISDFTFREYMIKLPLYICFMQLLVVSLCLEYMLV